MDAGQVPWLQPHRDVAHLAAQLCDGGHGVVGLDSERDVAVSTRTAVEAQDRHAGPRKLARHVLIEEVRALGHGRAVQDDHRTARRPYGRHVQCGG